MSDKHEENVEELQKHVVELRRKAVSDALAGTLPAGSDVKKQLEYIMFLQSAVDSLDRALEDEKKRRPSVYETRGLAGV